MTQFYTRYVPLSKNQAQQPANQVNSPGKRKHNGTVDGKTNNKRHKVDNNHFSDGATSPATQRKPETSGDNHAKSVLKRYSVTGIAKSQDDNVDIKLRKKGQTGERKGKLSTDADEVNGASSPQANVSKQETTGDADPNINTKHSAILRKYDRSREQSRSHNQDNELKTVLKGSITKSNQETLRDLVPIPQPVGVRLEAKDPTYEALPAWLSTVTTVKHHETLPFSDLGLSDRMLSNLQSQSLHHALAIQSTIIPLLMPGSHRYEGDTCVSAATGSGKTLAYMVPIVELLQRRKKRSGLRAIIVVPTRELVKQVKKTAEICAAGFDLRIVAAMGSRSLQKEQEALIEWKEVYDPKAVEEERNTPMDLAEFSLERILQRAQRRDPEKLEDHVLRSSIKADILITTPGRLVDHLQNTDGFHLDHVEYVVIDEADRLLNESYQDWIFVVNPALESTRATEVRDRILRQMRMQPPPRIVRKVLLSATMTKDISKLNRMNLKNPELVVLDASHEASGLKVDPEFEDFDEGIATDALGKYSLPSRLKEIAVCLKEGIEKPLALLDLFVKHLNVLPNMKDQRPRVQGDDAPESSDNETSSNSDTSQSSSTDNDDTSEDDATDTESTVSNNSGFDEEDTGNVRFNLSTDPNIHREDTLDTKLPTNRVLVFTRSTESASRLSRLLTIILPSLGPKITTLTRSTASSASSRRALSTFRNGKTPILIATDRVSRGIDVPGLEHVVSYDIPGSSLTYIHRVGRTARAGEDGHAWTLVEHREGRWFWQDIGGKSKDCIIKREQKIRRIDIEVEDDLLKKRYDDALQTLGSEVRGE